ncbi:hypothetical protein CCB80_01095 [Armatimonadetes bacterium Uphvl-Ar1]|nr:hypothetical protein CCB80_01095 [Armatimonadetes bacterium Uphvl-Ar1]
MTRTCDFNWNSVLIGFFILACLGCSRPPTRVSPLHQAAASGDLETTRLLLQRGDDINSKDSDGNTALVHAISMQHWHVADELLARGCRLDYKNSLGINPFVQFAKYGNSDQKKWINRNFKEILARD